MVARSFEGIGLKKSSHNRRWKEGALCALGGFLLAVVIMILGFGGLQSFLHTAKIAAVMRTIGMNYVGDYDLDELTDLALTASVGSLDRWSYYMDAESYAEYENYSANVHPGIGVTIMVEEQTGGFEIITMNKGEPAQLAGLQVGEIIVAVDGVDVTHQTTEDVRALIQADYGKEAVITVLTPDGISRDVAVSCKMVYDNPVSYELLDGHVGYIDINNFRAGAGEQAILALEDLMEQGIDSVVFDVRSNAGGMVTEMVEILDYLLPEGDVFISVNKRGRESVEKSDAQCVQLPMAVVVNTSSYSAAEFFAAALRDYDWAVVVGEQTTGKARSQVTYTLRDGSAVHLSTASYLTPSRINLYDAGGMTPDVEVLLSEEEQTLFVTGWLEPADDPQIQAAIDALGA